MILAQVCVWSGTSVECLAVGRLCTASRSSAAGLPGADGEEQSGPHENHSKPHSSYCTHLEPLHSLVVCGYL